MSFYYLKQVKRKLAAEYFSLFPKIKSNSRTRVKQILSNSKDSSVKLKPYYYHSLDFLPTDFIKQLGFENQIAVKERNGPKNPLTPALYGLHLFNESVKENKLGNWRLIDLQLDYLKSISQGDKLLYWNYSSEFKRLELTPPWTSGLSQSLIASLYIRKYQQSNDDQYLTIAQKSMAYCLKKENGLLSLGDDDYFWIEEYPGLKGAGVLNGFIFSLIALGELSYYGFFKKEFDKGLKTLKKQLPNYHVGPFLKYSSNLKDLANPKYQTMHYYQLVHLSKMTGDNSLNDLAITWLSISGLDLSTL